MTKLEIAILKTKEALSQYSKDTWEIEILTENIYQLLDLIVGFKKNPNKYKADTFSYELIQGDIKYNIISGRWTIDYLELAPGTIFEIFINEKWVKVKMEFDGNKYYITVPEIKISEGIKGRIKPAEFGRR